MHFQASFLLPLLPAMVSAVAAPVYPDLGKPFWQETFTGPAGASPDTSKWNFALDLHNNGELETYTTSNSNTQLSGGETIQFVPRRSSSGEWTSGRIESKETITPAPGKVTQVEASIRMGGNSLAEMAGIWPAFWMLGDSIHHGTDWPACGEIDIFEQINGLPTVFGTAHCTTCGVLGSSGGIQGSVVADGGAEWHTYAVKIDRTHGDDWAAETITWMRDGQDYFTLAGGTVADQATWSTLAHSPLFVILNLAVGGDWPGAPTEATLDGFGSMMEVEYVAAYSA